MFLSFSVSFLVSACFLCAMCGTVFPTNALRYFGEGWRGELYEVWSLFFVFPSSALHMGITYMDLLFNLAGPGTFLVCS